MAAILRHPLDVVAADGGICEKQRNTQKSGSCIENLNDLKVWECSETNVCRRKHKAIIKLQPLTDTSQVISTTCSNFGMHLSYGALQSPAAIYGQN